MKGHIAMDRRILVLPKQEPFGFTRISEVRVNSRVMGLQMYYLQMARADLDCRIRREGLRRYEKVAALDIRS